MGDLLKKQIKAKRNGTDKKYIVVKSIEKIIF